MRLFLMIIFFSPWGFTETVQETKQDRYYPREPAVPMNQVARELVCLQGAAREKYGNDSLMKRDFTTVMVQIYSESLQKGFDGLEMGPLERAAFYSHMIVETGGFTHMSEAGVMSDPGVPSGHNSREKRCALMGLVHGLRNIEATRDKALFPQGRGLLQTTHCDGMIASLHYLRTKEWRLNWNSVYPIGQTCTRDDLKTFAVAYKNSFREDLDPLHVLDNMNKIGAPCGQYISDTGREVSSEQMTVDLALAFWRGQCGQKARTVLRGSDAYCSAYRPKNDTEKFNNDETASRCLTKCVRGSTSGWEQRNEWYLMAKECNQRMAR